MNNVTQDCNAINAMNVSLIHFFMNAYSIGLCGNINGFNTIIPIYLFCVTAIGTIHFRFKLIDQILLYSNGAIFVIKLAL